MKRSLAALALAVALAAPPAGAQDPSAPPGSSPAGQEPPSQPAPESPPATSPPATPSEPSPSTSQQGGYGQQQGGYGATSAYGLVLSADLGGGGRLGGGSEFTPRGVFEGEITAGYELAAGFRPELSLLLGVAPHSNAGLRLGLHYALPDMPFYLRAALDGSTERGTARWRWLLYGGGGEVRLTDVLGAFGEADLGIPLSSGAGVPVLIRAGVTFRM